MKEVLIDFDNKSPANVNECINIAAFLTEKEIIEYKFMEGFEGIWNPIQGFSENNICKWIPKKPGKYMIMVQGKSKKCENIYDYLGRAEYEVNIVSEIIELDKTNKDNKIITEEDVTSDTKIENVKSVHKDIDVECAVSIDIEEVKNSLVNEDELINEDISVIEEALISEEIKIIKDVSVDNNKINIGEKATLIIKTNEELVLYRFWIKGSQGWEALRDYATDNKFVFTATDSGSKEILIECKRVSSEKNVDDFTTVKIDVKDLSKIEITDFKCLSLNMIVNEELVFKVEANYQQNRPILYKFLKVDKAGKLTCIQDFSSKSMVSFREREAGEYRLLCLTRDMFSTKAYDDRALIAYSVEPYENITIKSFKADLSSPQAIGNFINFNSIVSGGRELVYRYIIEGPTVEDSGYIRNKQYVWEPTEEGDYKITLKVRDISFKGDYEDVKVMNYEIYKKGERPVRIIDIKSDKGKKCLIGETVNISVKVEGGLSHLYKFVVYKDGIQKEYIDYGKNNWVNFTPEERGIYEVEVMSKDSYSSKEYDSVSSIYFEAKEYVPADIEYILINSREMYLVNDIINIEGIMLNTTNVLVRYVTKINGQEVEDTGFIKNKVLRVKPRCPGKYSFVIYAKNIKSTEEYDSKKEVSVYVQEVRPVSSTKVYVPTYEIKIGKEVNFEVKSEGGKDVCYQFYIMNKGQWALVQNYSKKNYYTFVPFTEGEYRILALSKSYHKKDEYEDYDIATFSVAK